MIDLKDTYLHVPIHPASYKYLWLAVVLLPGSTIQADYAATHIHMVVEFIASYLRPTYSLHVNWLFRHQHQELLIELATKVIAFLQSFRWEVNLEKSSLTPSQSFEYLGLRFRSDLGVVRPGEDHLLDKLQ